MRKLSAQPGPRICLSLVCLAFVLFSCTLHAEEIASTWQGSFQSDTGQHRAVLQITNSENGAPQSGSVFVEHFPDWLNVNSLTLTGSSLKIKINGGTGTYEGTMNADGSVIQGTWTYAHRSSPLELHRTTEEAAAHVPFAPYQYFYKTISVPRPDPSEAKIAYTPKLAVDYMEHSALAWAGERQCVACHTVGSYMVTRPMMTAQLGPPQKELRDFLVSQLKEQLAVDPKDPNTDLAVTQIIYIAAGLAIWDAHVSHQLSPETALALGLMFKLQRAGGDWYMDDEGNPPLESSHYQLATVAARAVGNAPGWLAQQRGTPVEAQVARLAEDLREEKKLQADYDRTDLLWAASELPGLISPERTKQLVTIVSSHQMQDGGWSIRTFAQPEEWGTGNRAAKLRAEAELNHPASDGHMTGLAIIALRQSGVPATDPRIQRGVAWLLANQRSSGRWWTRSLIGDNWQFMSYSGTVYPLLALSMCDALPASNQQAMNGQQVTTTSPMP